MIQDKMPLVVEHLLARKNKSVPIGDGRKISLVLFGGVMVGVRGAGALVALEELGLSRAFDEIYTMSSGFINASAFLGGQIKKAAETYYKKLSGRKFLNFFRLWKIADMEYLLKVVDEEKLDFKTILQGKTKLQNMFINLSKDGRTEYLEVHDFREAEYRSLLEASLCLKYIAGGKIKIRGSYYRDIVADRAVADFFEHVLNSGATDVLVIYNYSWQTDYIRENFSKLDNQKVCEVSPDFDTIKSEFWQKMERFETRSAVLKNDCQMFAGQVKNLFGSSEPIKLL